MQCDLFSYMLKLFVWKIYILLGANLYLNSSENEYIACTIDKVTSTLSV